MVWRLQQPEKHLQKPNPHEIMEKHVYNYFIFPIIGGYKTFLCWPRKHPKLEPLMEETVLSYHWRLKTSFLSVT